MKILWISDIAFPGVYDYLKFESPVNAGWVYSAAQKLLENTSRIDLATAVVMKVPKFTIISDGNVKHYVLPSSDKMNTDVWKFVLEDFSPTIIHVHGTEYPYLSSFLRNRRNEKVVVSIQGLVSVIHRFYFAGIKKRDLFFKITIRDIIRFDTVFHQKFEMKKRGMVEKSVIRSVDAVIGRTDWDRAHTLAINPNIHYFYNNETLRKSFYNGSWNFSNCQKFRIFISQGHYPIKGIHQLIKALPLIVSSFPKTEVYIAGHDFFNNRGFKIHGYGKYINRLIKKLGLEKYIYFTGLLTEEKIKEQYLKAHVFVCPSAIENSPNSLGEAQILGTPCIVSNVGGVSNMVDHGKTGLLYRFEEYEVLAYYIKELFSKNALCEFLSLNSKEVALARHNPDENSSVLVSIYDSLLNN